MKKSLVALAVLAAAGAASAQSSVTLFGVVDVTYARGDGKGTGSSDKTQLTNSGYNSSRLGFRGVEDLGGGMSASFWLEAGISNDDGRAGGSIPAFNQATTAAANTGLNFNRRSTVSLSGSWGEARFGRDYTSTFWNLTIFDPYGTNGVGTTQTLNSGLGGPVAVRASNTMGYFLPRNLGGFYGQLQYYMGENNSPTVDATTGRNIKDDGTGFGGRIGYAAGPVNVAFAAQSTKYAITGNIDTWNMGGQYDFGVAKVMAHYSEDKVKSTATTTTRKGKGYLIGGLFPIGAGEIRASYSQYKVDQVGLDPRSAKWALGYVHNLSKRTALYATYANVSNKDGAASALNGSVTAVNNSSSGYDFGIRHSF